VKKSQMQIIEALDRQMSSEDVMKVLRKKIDRLESGDVDARNLFKTRKVSKTLQQYSSNSLSALCLRRAREKNVEIMSGQELQFLVSDNERKDIDRVRLGFEDAGRYDETYYIKELVRAAETVLSPLGIKRKGIRERLEETGKARVKEYTD
jgi:DNA polymerase I